MSITSPNLLSPLGLATTQSGGSQGFSLLELAVVTCLIGILLAVAIKRLLPYIDEAERVAVITLEAQIRNTLVMAAAQRIARGQSASISALNGSNPMDLMLESPGNYLGALDAADLPAAAPSGWFFDLTTNRLVYRPRQRFTFRDDDSSVEQLEFEVRVAFADRNRDGVFEPAIDDLYGVRLLRVAGGEWLNTGKDL